MRSRVAICQSNYIPWKGYFDLINDVDLFIFLDDAQFTIRDWRNRNRIKTPKSCRWLTVPVGDDRNRLICDVGIKDPSWQQSHFQILRQYYRDAPYFDHFKPLLSELYLKRRWTNLSQLNQHAVREIAGVLGIKTSFLQSSDFQVSSKKERRILDLLKAVGARVYVSGPAAKAYLDPARFEGEGISVVWKDYSGYPEYPQLHPPFEHAVTILDLLFHCGPYAAQKIWEWRQAPEGGSLAPAATL